MGRDKSEKRNTEKKNSEKKNSEKKNTKKLSVKKTDWIRIWMLFFTFVLQIGMTLLFGKLVYTMETEQLLRCIVVAGITFGCTVLTFSISREDKQLPYENEKHEMRFYVCYTIVMLFSLLLPLIDFEGWPFLVIFVAVALFGNWLCGFVSGTGLLVVCFLLSKCTDLNAFFLYFLAGMIGCIVFRTLDENFKFVLPLFMAVLMLFVLELSNVILFKNEKLTLELFILPTINIVLSTMLLIIILKIFSTIVVHRNLSRYMEINDPEYPLLVALKEHSTKDYYHAVHTAYLCDRLAKVLDLDVNVVKCAGYYSHIGTLKDNDSWETVRMITNEYNFPEAPMLIMEEFLDKKKRLVSKESAVVFFSDLIVTSICYLLEKDPNCKLDYDSIINTIFKKRMDNGILNNSNLSMREINIMKAKFLEEKLYYDFLR